MHTHTLSLTHTCMHTRAHTHTHTHTHIQDLQEADANFLRKPDRPLSLFEGIAGTLCFYSALADPETARFPLFEV